MLHLKIKYYIKINTDYIYSNIRILYKDKLKYFIKVILYIIYIARTF